MLLRLTPGACAVAAALASFSPTLWAQTPAALPSVTVTATQVEMLDTEAPYASEVHTRQDIERSGAANLYDYLAQQTSLQIAPSSGNRANPKISMRGYGFEGYQNLTITVDGRSLNAPDMVPQLIGAISLADIERIEITKGSGAVMFGDHATAGTIQIYTKAHDRAHLDAYTGSHGQRGTTASLGLVREKFDVSATADHNRSDGFGQADTQGHTDNAQLKSWRLAANIKPLSGLRVHAQAGQADVETRFINPVTLTQLNTAPSTNSGTYTHTQVRSEYWSVGAEQQIHSAWKLSTNHRREKKSSDSLWSGLYPDTAQYQVVANDIALQFQKNHLTVHGGLQVAQHERENAWNSTRKKNQGAFIHGQYAREAWLLSAGLRREQVRYTNTPIAGTRLQSHTQLTSWEMGANRRLSESLTAFANYSDAFNTPDIDRFFDYGTFNSFIEPAKSRTWTVGTTHTTQRNQLKASAFYARLRNEIYAYSGTFGGSFKNTNLDKSHKYGLEIQNRYQATPRISALVNYTWTRAIIDQENEGNGAFNGKELPGVSRHSLVLGLNARVAQSGQLAVTHTWRSSAWAEEDLSNTHQQRQRAHHSTDVSYRHQVTPQMELYGSVHNLFARANGIWLRDDVIYPVNFERTWKLGARLTF